MWGLLFPITSYSGDVELKNLRWNWEVFDEDEELYVPYFKQSKTNVVRFEVDLKKFSGAYLKLTFPEQHFVWIQRELVYGSEVYQSVYLSLDSLHQVYRENRIYVAIHSQQLNASMITTQIIKKEKGEENAVAQSSFLVRGGHKKLDLFIIISMVTMSLVALLRAFSFRLFKEYFSVIKAIQVRQNFDLIIAHSPMAWPNIGFVVFYALLVGSTVINIGLFHPDFFSSFSFYSDGSGMVKVGLEVSVYCFVLILFKLIVVSINTQLFKIKKVRLIHFFAYFRLSLIIATVAFSLSVINGIFGGLILSEHATFIKIIVLLSWIGRLILIFFVLNKIYTFRKLHLFSYLCSTELIPLLLFFKIFLK
ncbi:DUF4271 domain-containing protein [Reichenbachiella carrageenanivorans]|uniref:DUF4271 domain-containing protein n=1 Tax=Reichenbachiella carrageenanivorans TaxID=2979869 RepID=A0ABY6D525_9BACT|nr:DUF4271 domain-containing protein [Reichenbachiella carrageenanivorans]UXX80158.1 DUF4271 domain-containing protein [Reichenbachiella carrageenanivorans]